jgi:putative transposase
MNHKNYEWRTGRSQLYKHFYHLVFVTKYRRGVFTKEMLDRVHTIFKETCLQMDCELLEFNGEDDHVHILISIPPKHSVTNIVSKLKGKSSYFIRKEFWDHIKKKLWGEHFWSPSYCSVTCGGAPLEIIKKYIDDQRLPSSEKGVAQSIRERKVRLRAD